MKGNVVYIAIAGLCGVVIGYQQLQPFHFIALLFYFLFLFIRKRAVLPICLCAAAFFSLYMLWVDRHNKTVLSRDQMNFSVRFITSPAIDGDQLKGIVKTINESEKLQLVYRIKSEREQQQLSGIQIGMICTFRGTLKTPEPARNIGAFDYRRYLRFQHIHWIVQPSSFSLRHCRPTPLTVYESLLLMRKKGLDDIESSFPSSTVGIVQALVYGERTEMDDSLLDAYQKLGLVHLLAISGSHVTLLVRACFYMFIRFITREQAALVLLLLLPVYTVITGASPSVVRASLTAMILLWFSYKKSIILPLDALSAVFLAMLIVQPYALFQAGFQLSFIVSFTLILSIEIIEQYLSPLTRLFMTTLIAQISALPFLLYHFFEFSLLSLPFNIVFIPLYSFVILPLSLVSLAAHYIFEPMSSFLMKGLEQIITISNEWVLAFKQHHSLSLILGRPSPFLLTCYSIAIVFAFMQMEQKQYRSLLWIAAVVFLHMIVPYFNRYGEVVVLDVGQGDCIYIELPYRKGVYLIDTGGEMKLSKQPWQKRQKEWSVGNNIVIPFLKAKGIRKLDRLIITHGDADHMGAAIEVINAIQVKEMLIGKGGAQQPLQMSLIAAAKKQGVAIREVGRGEGWEAGSAIFYVLNPSDEKELSTDNNRSVVVYAKLGALSWLFTGDLEKEGEEKLIRAFPHLRVDILKVGHHGSATSTSEHFLQTIQPKIAVISVGKNNRYHHPHPDVIERLQKHHIKVLRTDQHGAIQYIYNKKFGTFTVMLP
ncbi:DNA internalization-related competence protein ComEC/Rec2 [Anoxybacteroides tepidamans]|uniref:DNA internalization-related competence protein ComEC/Rec2 n=1 Tax=Anoxybacteroides tepidamans TaxID=265948 RepID=UPI000487B50D|nr:DNA internalization-related competence protein ComEC/Rec2 [Anoxybacillus tepidamans]